ncbi:MAG: Fe-S protein assembly co-chaperone HscB [Alphaproteobacteria bacterium]|nr:Fe-S protein assembly co-chaperone HscB [Alphaproteobacteria bacterium]
MKNIYLISVDIVLTRKYHEKDMSEKNYFSIFNLPVSYNIDESKLTDTYFRLQRQWHPDSFSENSTEADKTTSVDLNIAYKILMNPIDRAEHFLELQGESIIDTLPTNIAEEMFELRQKYALLSSDIEKLQFVDYIKRRMTEIIFSLRILEADIKKFKDQAGLLRFLNSFLEKVESNAYSGN